LVWVAGLLGFRKGKERKETTQVAKSSSHQSRKRGHLRRKAPSPEKKKAVIEDKEGCGQTSQQTSPDFLKVRRMLKRTSSSFSLAALVR